MKKFVVLSIALTSLLLIAAGCATLPRAGGVAVTLVSIVPQQSSLFETSALLTLRFTNEMAHPIELSGSTHRLYINGTAVGRAVTNERTTIPHLGTTTQTMTAHLENLALMRKAQELGNVPSVDYRIESRLHPIGERGEIAATATGQLDLSGLMPAADGGATR